MMGTTEPSSVITIPIAAEKKKVPAFSLGTIEILGPATKKMVCISR